MAKRVNVKDFKSSDTIGLWYQSDTHRYTSAAFDVSGLRDFKGTVRLVMYKNRQHKDGDKRPSYVFKFCGVNTNESNIEVKDLEFVRDGPVTFDDRCWIPVDQAVSVARSRAYMIRQGYDEFDAFCNQDFYGDECQDGVYLKEED